MNIFDSPDAPFWADIQFISYTMHHKTCGMRSTPAFCLGSAAFIRPSFLSCVLGILYHYIYHLLPIISYVDLCVLCGPGKAQFEVRNQAQEDVDRSHSLF